MIVGSEEWAEERRNLVSSTGDFSNTCLLAHDGAKGLICMLEKDHEKNKFQSDPKPQPEDGPEYFAEINAWYGRHPEEYLNDQSDEFKRGAKWQRARLTGGY